VPVRDHRTRPDPGAPPAQEGHRTVADTFTCPFCHLVFSGRSEFLNHLEVEHPDRYHPKPAEHPSPRDSSSGRS